MMDRKFSFAFQSLLFSPLVITGSFFPLVPPPVLAFPLSDLLLQCPPFAFLTRIRFTLFSVFLVQGGWDLVMNGIPRSGTLITSKCSVMADLLYLFLVDPFLSVLSSCSRSWIVLPLLATSSENKPLFPGICPLLWGSPIRIDVTDFDSGCISLVTQLVLCMTSDTSCLLYGTLFPLRHSCAVQDYLATFALILPKFAFL